MMKLADIINLARLHTERAAMKSSAVLCAADAISLQHTNPEAARYWALKSLSYSVGVFHPDYRRAAE